MVNYTDFLSNRGNDPLRDLLWARYRAVERYFLCDLGFRMTVRHVRETTPGEVPYFDPQGMIAIPFKPNDQGVIFHEATHDLFHHSVFHRIHNQANAFPNGQGRNAAFNETWGEGFCDAVRWLMETAQLQTSAWLQSYPAQAATDWRIQRADRILNHTGRTLAEFAAGWNALTAGYDSKGDYLNSTIP